MALLRDDGGHGYGHAHTPRHRHRHTGRTHTGARSRSHTHTRAGHARIKDSARTRLHALSFLSTTSMLQPGRESGHPPPLGGVPIPKSRPIAIPRPGSKARKLEGAASVHSLPPRAPVIGSLPTPALLWGMPDLSLPVASPQAVSLLVCVPPWPPGLRSPPTAPHRSGFFLCVRCRPARRRPCLPAAHSLPVVTV